MDSRGWKVAQGLKVKGRETILTAGFLLLALVLQSRGSDSFESLGGPFPPELSSRTTSGRSQYTPEPLQGCWRRTGPRAELAVAVTGAPLQGCFLGITEEMLMPGPQACMGLPRA